MILSDRSIREELAAGHIVIDPLGDDCIQPASVDIHLARSVNVFRPWNFPHLIDLRQSLDGLTEPVEIPQDNHFALQPGQFVLGSTVEYIAIPNDTMARLEGKSSLGRVGLMIHSTAGYVDPGWQGHLTLELYNVSALPILLYAGMKISQLSFHRLTTPADRPYGSPGLGSKYKGQIGPTPTRFYQEFLQPQLMSTATVPASTKAPSSRSRHGPLREWLLKSYFRGSVKQFSEALGVSRSTVEGWIYLAAKPSHRYWPKLYTITGLLEYRSRAPTEHTAALKGLD